MKNIKYLLMFLVIGFWASCGSDDGGGVGLCADVACENGGTCVEGTCDCPDGFSGPNCENLDPFGVQGLLDGGMTPKEVLDDNIPLKNLYGKMYQGGLIFYLNTNNGTGMVAATKDQSPPYPIGATWGCYLEDIFYGASGVGIGAGIQNTIKIVNGCVDAGIAAKLCSELNLNGKDDWFLPSIDELNLMWINLADSDGDGYNLDGYQQGNIGNFASGFYWSSTEVDIRRAWRHSFITGSRSENGYTYTNLNVRAARAF